MEGPANLLEVYEAFEEEIKAIHAPQKAARILNELRSAMLHHLLPELGYQRAASGRKLSMAEVDAAKKHLKTVPVKRLLTLRDDLRRAFDKQSASKASRNTYRARVEQLLIWAEQEIWWPGSRLAKVRDQCCPPMRSKNGPTSSTPLTERRGRRLCYRLKINETNSSLQAELDKFHQFLTEPEWRGRVIDPVETESANEYLKDIRLFLGFLHRYARPPVPLDQLSLELLVPKITEEELEELDRKQQKKIWKQKKEVLETLLYDYFRFIREFLKSNSPRTKNNKLGAILALAKFQYTSEVEREEDYFQIPLFTMLGSCFGAVSRDLQEWQQNRQYVSDQSKKWPDVAEGETALTTVRKQIVAPLRQECRARNKRGDFRRGFLIATSHQHYLKWALQTDMPARRQQEHRTLRITLTCPIRRPEEVPPDGLYHPLPPNDRREKRLNGLLKDNFLHKTYIHKKKHYKDGVWVLDTQGYKTRKTHGAQSIVIPNRQYEDGSCLYDYLERYLYGWWIKEGYKHRQLYDWWQPELKGRLGRWVTSGRTEFNPGDACYLPTSQTSATWSWGYVFVVPRLGIPASGSTFAGSFERTAHRLIGKRISPHQLRSCWATWGYQVRLSDYQLRSLAYAMGHTVETMREMYERCTPEEKRQAIEEAIDERLFNESPWPKDD